MIVAFVAVVAAVSLLSLILLLVGARRERRSLAKRLEAAHRELERLQRSFARFAPSSLVDRIIDRGTDILAEKRPVTVLFADIQGFTNLTERLEPAVLLRVLGGYFAAMSDAITRHHGQVNRFIGDGLMALFGALETNPWQVKDSVQAALAMRDSLSLYNEGLAAEGLPPLAIGMGIHHGTVVAGVMGGEELLQFDVYGDVVNVASRVEGLTRGFGTDLLVTDAVQAALEGQFITRQMPPATVRGKSVPIQTFAVDGAAGS